RAERGPDLRVDTLLRLGAEPLNPGEAGRFTVPVAGIADTEIYLRQCAADCAECVERVSEPFIGRGEKDQLVAIDGSAVGSQLIGDRVVDGAGGHLVPDTDLPQCRFHVAPLGIRYAHDPDSHLAQQGSCRGEPATAFGARADEIV